MSNSDWITIWGIAISVFASIGSALVLAFKMGGLQEKVMSMEKILSGVVKDIDNLKIIVAQLVVKVEVLWLHHLAGSNSPIILNDIGRRCLETSGIDSFAANHYDEILSRVRMANPKNAYQAQESLISILSSYRHADACSLELQNASFISGHDIDSVLFVAALSIRDRVLFELGFGQ